MANENLKIYENDPSMRSPDAAGTIRKNFQIVSFEKLSVDVAM